MSLIWESMCTDGSYPHAFVLEPHIPICVPPSTPNSQPNLLLLTLYFRVCKNRVAFAQNDITENVISQANAPCFIIYFDLIIYLFVLLYSTKYCIIP